MTRRLGMAFSTIVAIVAIMTETDATGTRAMATEPPATLANRAQEMAKQGYTALKAKDYAEAADHFEAAASLWKQLADNDEFRDQATREAKRCQNNFAFAVGAPIRGELDRAKRWMAEGDAERASLQFIRVMELYDQALARCDSGVFRQNKKYCATYAGLAPIRQADKFRKSGEFGKAAELYRVAVRRYHQVHQLLGKKQFAKNIEYAEQYLAQTEFADRLDRHEPATPFDLPSLTQGHVTLKSTRGKVTLVVVWAAWCGYCRKDLPVIDEFLKKYKADELAVVGLCLDRVRGWDRGREKQAQQLAKELAFPNAWCDDETLLAYGDPPSVPTAYWLDQDGHLVAKASLKELTIEKLIQQARSVSHWKKQETKAVSTEK